MFRRLPRGDDRAGLSELAAAVAAHVGALQGTLGDVRPLAPPPWYGLSGAGSTRFVGRLPAMWQIHSALHAGELTPLTGKSGPGVAQVRGLGGIGKTLLAEEYALRFGAAYPGGVFWLRAQAGDGEGELATGERSAEHDQLQGLALALGLAPERLATPQDFDPVAYLLAVLRAELERRGQPCLWLVDDIPPGLDAEQLRRWFQPLAKTLFTTRSRAYAALAAVVEPGLLSPAEAYELLSAARPPEDEAEAREARGLAAELGYHALALDVTAAALRAAGPGGYADWRARLARPGRDALEHAARLADVLPSGHEPSIAATLLGSIEGLGAEGRDLLGLGSLLAAAPIPAALVQSVFAVADGLEGWQAQVRSELAREQAGSASLIHTAGGGESLVHALVARTVRFSEQAAPERGTGCAPPRWTCCATSWLRSSSLPPAPGSRRCCRTRASLRAMRRRCPRPIDTGSESVDVVRSIFEAAKRGETPGQIAEFLNRRRIASPSGRAWNGTTVRNMLENPAYAGERYGVKRAHPAIVSRRLWNAAQAALGQRSRG